MKVKENRSSLKAKPLNGPGQSLQDEIFDIITDRIAIPALVALILSLVAAIQFIGWRAETPPNLLLSTVLAVASWAYYFSNFRRMEQRIHDLKQGRDGERAVGQYLERSREDGAQVFHDIPAKGFNVDHVVISPRGVYAIETKTLSKPAQGNPTAWVQDGKLLVDGHTPDRNPIEQARAVADWTQKLLCESTGRAFPVRPVVLLPGWYVERVDKTAANGVWVLNPKALPSFIANEAVVMRAEDVKLAAYHLSRYARTAVQW